MNELTDVVHKPDESGLSPEEVKDILWFLSGNLFYSFCICILFNQKLYVWCTYAMTNVHV